MYNESFINYISKISNVFLHNAKDLDVVMQMYNLNTVKYKGKQQVLYGIVTEMNLIIFLLMMMNLLLLIIM